MSPSPLKSPKFLLIVAICLIIIYYYSLSTSFSPVVENAVEIHGVPDTKPDTSTLEKSRWDGPDDPKLIEHLRKDVLLPPAGPGKFKRLLTPDKREAHSELYPIVRDLVKNMTGGFFIECGANDGEFISNTLDLELSHGWTGLLVEADPTAAEVLKGRQRNAWVAEACLSIEKHPMQIEMLRWLNYSALSGIRKLHKNPGQGTYFKADCYPLSSLLYALNRPVVDYFSLDIEGAELPVLKTIPWDQIRINVLSIEVDPSGIDELRKYLATVGMRFKEYMTISDKYIHDAFFVHEKFKP